MSSPNCPPDEATGKRKSHELIDAVESSTERFSHQVDSSVLSLVDAGGAVFTAGVRLMADVAEAAVGFIAPERFLATESPEENPNRVSRILNAHKDTIAEAVRIHNRAMKQAVKIAQDSADRIADRTAPPAPPSPIVMP